jgi:primosomal protein N'
VFFALEKIYLEQAEKFLFFNKMHAPIKRIKNKYRYQVLMRLADASVLKEIYAICADARTRDVLVSVEENPSNLS